METICLVMVEAAVRESSLDYPGHWSAAGWRRRSTNDERAGEPGEAAGRAARQRPAALLPGQASASSSAQAGRAAEYFRCAIEKDANYSAAWKMLGKALAEAGQPQDALAAYRKGIEVAEGKGDKQAAKEMTVFARRIEKVLAQGEPGAGRYPPQAGPHPSIETFRQIGMTPVGRARQQVGAAGQPLAPGLPGAGRGGSSSPLPCGRGPG
ncbi:MAG: hypothetical protein MZW92_13360 [Comamonadaceae bacterium]|nr:hypothetical protein [Comamonadaceae bacterium]